MEFRYDEKKLFHNSLLKFRFQLLNEKIPKKVTPNSLISKSTFL